MRRERYLEKLELFEDELDFIESHNICDEISMDLVAMLTKDAGLVVR